MNTKKITDEEIASLKIASLPSRPSAPLAFGGLGYTSGQMKAAFDRLPLYAIDRLNSLIDDLGALGESSAAATIPTGISEGHSLYDLFCDLKNGNASSYITVLGEPLAALIAELRYEIELIAELCGARAALDEARGVSLGGD